MSSDQNFCVFLTSLMRPAFQPISLSLGNVPKNLRVKLFYLCSKLLLHLQEILNLSLYIVTINGFWNYFEPPYFSSTSLKEHDTNLVRRILEWYLVCGLSKQGILDFTTAVSYLFLAPVAENHELKKGLNVAFVFSCLSLPSGRFPPCLFQRNYTSFLNAGVPELVLFYRNWLGKQK